MKETFSPAWLDPGGKSYAQGRFSSRDIAAGSPWRGGTQLLQAPVCSVPVANAPDNCLADVLPSQYFRSNLVHQGCSVTQCHGSRRAYELYDPGALLPPSPPSWGCSMGKGQGRGVKIAPTRTKHETPALLLGE